MKNKKYQVYSSDDKTINSSIKSHELTLKKTRHPLKFLFIKTQRLIQSIFFDKKISKTEFLTILHRNTPIGIVFLSDANSYRTPFLPIEAKEITIIISPSYRNLGYGKKVLSLLKETRHGIFALVRVLNFPSNNIFKSEYTLKFSANQNSGILGNRYFTENDKS